MYIYHCSKKLQKWFPLIDNATAEAFRGIADVLNSALPEKDLMKRYETLNGTHWNPICQTTHGDTFTAAEHIRVTPACPQSAQMWPCDVTWQIYAYFWFCSEDSNSGSSAAVERGPSRPTIPCLRPTEGCKPATKRERMAHSRQRKITKGKVQHESSEK